MLENCVKQLKFAEEKALNRKSKGNRVDSNIKNVIIANTLGGDKDALATLISNFEPLIDVTEVTNDKGKKEILYHYKANEKIRKEILQAIQVYDDTNKEGEKGKAFVAEDEKHKIGNVKVVKSIINYIPLVTEYEHFNNLNLTIDGSPRKYKATEYLDSVKVMSFLREIYREKRPINSVEDLKEFLRDSFDTAGLSETNKRTLTSLYLFLFNDKPVIYKINGEEQLVHSIYSEFKKTNNKVYKVKLIEDLKGIEINLKSVNDISDIGILTDEGLYTDSRDSTLKTRIDLERITAHNLYEVSELENTEVKLKDSALEQFDKRDITIFKNTNKKGLNIQLKYTLNGIEKRLTLPFDVRVSSLQSPIFVENLVNQIAERQLSNFKDINLAKEAVINLLKNKEFIKNLIDLNRLTFFNDNLIDSYLNDKSILDEKTRIDNLYNFLIPHTVALSLNVSDEIRGRLNSSIKNPFPIPTITNNKDYEGIFNDYKNGKNLAESNEKILIQYAVDKSLNKSNANNAKNINKILMSSVLSEVSEDKTDVKSIFNNPLMLWLNYDNLAKKYMDVNGLFRNQKQYNASGEIQERGSVVSPVEQIHRKVEEFKSIGSKFFKNNLFVKGGYEIIKLVRFTGYKDSEISKDQMNFNESEITYSMFDMYAKKLMATFNPTTKSTKEVSIFTDVYSDKSFFANFEIAGQYNTFPLKEVSNKNVLDIDYLYKKYYETEKLRNEAIKEQFVRKWNRWISKEEKYLTLKGINLVGNYTVENISDLIKALKTIPVPSKPLSLLVNKDYVNNKGTFSIKPSLEKELLTNYDFSTKHYNRLKKEMLSKFTLDRHLNIKNGLEYDKNVINFLEEQKVEGNLNEKPVDNLNLQDFYEGETNAQGYKLALDSNGDFVTKDFNNSLEEVIIKNVNPIELAYFFNLNIYQAEVSNLILGTKWQYKGNTTEAMLKDKLKRSVGASAPGLIMSLDTSLKDSFNYSPPRFGNVLMINDDTELTEVLGVGYSKDGKETNDGGGLTTELDELMYQSGFGDNIGLYPNSVLKFIYSNTNPEGEQSLIKYASHVLKEEMWDKGMTKTRGWFKVMLGSIPFDRDVFVNEITILNDGKKVVFPAKIYSSENTIFDIFLDLKEFKESNNLQFKTFRILADIICSNKNSSGILDLKTKHISQTCFQSNVKTGQNNLHNSLDVLNSVNGKYLTPDGQELSIKDYLVKIDNSKLTLQLDATHSPENPSVTKFSQAISNCILEGRTFSNVENMLNAEAASVRLGALKVQNIFEGNIDFETDEKDFDINTFDLINVKEFKDVYENASDKDELTKDLITRFNELPLDLKNRLLIRKIVLDDLEKEGDASFAFDAFKTNTFSLNDPTFTKTIASKINSYVSKQTINTSFAGGNYILTVTTDLLGLVDMVNPETNKKITTTLDKISVFEAKGYVKTTLEEYRNLKWKQYENTETGKNLFDKDEEGQYTNPIWSNFWNVTQRLTQLKDAVKNEKNPITKKSLSKEYKKAFNDKLKAKGELQKHLEIKNKDGEFIYKINRAEFVMPYAYKKQFGILTGMQPDEVDVEFFANQNKNKHYISLLADKASELNEKAKVEFINEINNEFLKQNNNSENQVTNYFFGNALFTDYINGLSLEEVAQRLSLDEQKLNNLLTEYSNFLQQYIESNVLFESLLEKIKTPEQILEEAKIKYQNFQKSLEILVNRIPSTGMQSLVAGKIVGFVESMQNSCFVPLEIMVIQGADLDIDKGVIIGWNFDKDGNLINDGVSTKSLQNTLVQEMHNIAIHPSNQIQSDTPVGMDTLSEIKDDELSKMLNVFGFQSGMTSTIVAQKILTAEGKSVLGNFANGLKGYDLVYFASKIVDNLNKLGKKIKYPLKPIQLDVLVFNEDLNKFEIVNSKYDNIANLNNQDFTRVQTWEFISELVNAAADNAKEMILGAVGASLQTGNMINAAVLYGMNPKDLFVLLKTPVCQKVLYTIRHQKDFFKTQVDVSTISEIIGKLTKEGGLSEVDLKLLKSLEYLYQMGEEFGVLSKLLSINREIPNDYYSKYDYNQKIETFINNKIESNSDIKDKKAFQFNFSKFVADEVYQSQWVNLYETMKDSCNILQVISLNPHIKEYTIVKELVDGIVDNNFIKYKFLTKALNNIKEIIKENSTKIKNLSENSVANVERLFNEFILDGHLKTKKVSITSKDFSKSFDLSKLRDRDTFLKLYPDYLQKVVENNYMLKTNNFFNTLTTIVNKKGRFLGVPNLADFAEERKIELKLELNKVIINPIEIETEKGKEYIDYNEFINTFFTYSLMISKGSLSKDTYFELFNSDLKREYTDFINNNTDIFEKLNLSDKQYIKESLLFNLFVPEISPTGKKVSSLLKREYTDYNGIERALPFKEIIELSTKGRSEKDLPKVIVINNKNRKISYALTEYENRQVYAKINPLFAKINVIANDSNQETHYLSTFKYKKIDNIESIKKLYSGESVKLYNNKLTYTQTIKSNVGDLKYNALSNTLVKESKELNLNNNLIIERESRQYLNNVLEFFKNKFNVNYQVISNEFFENNKEFSLYKDSKGFVKDGVVYINQDLYTIDTPIHEFAHIYINIIKNSNPALYTKIVELALNSNNYISQRVRNKYESLSEEDLGEEIFVTYLGLFATNELDLNLLEEGNFIDKAKRVIKDFYSNVKSIFSSLGINTNNIENLTLIDLLKSTKTELLNDIEFNLDKNVIKTPIKDGINDLFKEFKILNNIGTPQQFSEYLDTIKSNVILPTDKIVFGHPTIGKSFLKNQGEDKFISLDDDYATEINSKVKEIADKYNVTTYQVKDGGTQKWNNEYNQMMQEMFNVAKQKAISENKTLFTSNTNLLRNNAESFDKVINLTDKEFERRIQERGAKYDIKEWKSQINKAISKLPTNKVINTDKYLSDLFLGSKQNIEGFKKFVNDKDNKTLKLLNTVKQSKNLKISNVKDFISTIRPDSLTKTSNRSKAFYQGVTSTLFESFEKITPDKVFNDYEISKLAKEFTKATDIPITKSEVTNYYIAFKNLFKADEFTIKATANSDSPVSYKLLSDLENFSVRGEYPLKGKLKDYSNYNNILVRIDTLNGKLDFSFYDLDNKNLDTKIKNTTKQNNIFGETLTDKEARKLNIDFKNTIKDANALEIGIIGLEILKVLENTKYNTGINLIKSTSQNSFQGYFINDIVENLQNALSNDKFNKKYGEYIRPLLTNKKNELKDISSYRVNVLKYYTEFLNYKLKMSGENQNTKVRVTNLLKTIKNYEDNPLGYYNELLDLIIEHQNALIESSKNISTKNDVKISAELASLRELILELTNTRNAYRNDRKGVVDNLKFYTTRLGATSNLILDKIYQELRTAKDKVLNYIYSFEEPFNKKLKELIKDYEEQNGVIGSIIEKTTINDARKYFEPLLEKVKITKDKKEVEIYTGKLLNKNSKEYNDLTDVQKDFIKYFNSEVSKAIGLNGEKLNTEGFIPLQRNSFKNINVNFVKNLASKNIFENLKELGQGFKETYLDAEFENGEFFAENDKQNSIEVQNLFANQFERVSNDNSKFGNTNRLNLIGLKEENGKLELVDEEANKAFDTDLSMVLYNFVFNQVRYKEYNKINPVIDALRNNLLFKQKFLGNKDNAINLIEDYYKGSVNNMGTDDKGFKKLSKIMNKITTQSSVAMLGFKLSVGVSNFTTNVGTVVKEAMFGSLTKLYGDTPPFSLGSLAKASYIVTTETGKNPLVENKLDALNKLYKIYNQDINYLQDNLETKTSIFKNKHLYWLNTIGDKLTREVTLVAQMIEDGSWDAYTFENNELKYDETKDKRFYKNGSFDKNHPLLKLIKEEMIYENNGLTGTSKTSIESRKLTKGYSNKYRNGVKALSDKLYGSYDDENASIMQYSALGRLFLAFKKYMVDKGRQYFGSKVYTTSEINYIPIYKNNDPRGEIIGYKAEGSDKEGVFISLVNFLRDVASSRNIRDTYNNLTLAERRNLVYLLNDAMFLSVFLYGFYALFDEDDKELKSDVKYQAYKGFLDSASGNMIFGYDSKSKSPAILPQRNSIVEPFIPLSFMSGKIGLINAIMFADNNEERIKDSQKLIENLPFKYTSYYKLGKDAVEYYQEEGENQ